MTNARSFVGAVGTLVALQACRTVEPTSGPSTQTSKSIASTMASVTPSDVSTGPRATMATWGALRWDMDRPTAADMLRRAGYNVTVRGLTKTPSAIISAEVGASWLDVYFDEHGRMNQIMLATEAMSEQDARALRGKLDARFGRTTMDFRVIEKRWKLTAHGHISARVGQQDGGWFVHQERGHGNATTGSVGWGDLTWGANATSAEEKLKAAGFTTKVRASGGDPCKLLNAPPNCASGQGASLGFTKTEGALVVSGKLSFGTSGLGQVVIYKRGFFDQAAALAELSAIEATNGQPFATERSQHTTWRLGTGEVKLNVKQGVDGKWSAIETYLPFHAL
jgi:hypothetical protein